MPKESEARAQAFEEAAAFIGRVGVVVEADHRRAWSKRSVVGTLSDVLSRRADFERSRGRAPQGYELGWWGDGLCPKPVDSTGR